MNIIITTTISSVVSLVIGFLVAKLKEYRQTIKENKTNNDIQNEALKLLLQNALTNSFFVYEQTSELYDYQLKGWLNMFKIYKNLGGNDYVDELYDRIKAFKIVKTGIMKQQ